MDWLQFPAGCGPPQPRPPCLSVHIRPLGIFSRFADRRLSVFVIEFLLGRRAMPGAPACPQGQWTLLNPGFRMGHHRTVPGQLSVTERPVALPPSEAGG